MAIPLTVAWISYFPVEWLPDAPEEIRSLPRAHPTTWQRVLLGELEHRPALKLHVIVLRKHFVRDLTFDRNGVTFHLLKTVGGLRAPSFFWHDTWLIRRKLAAIKPAVVHAWGAEQGAAIVASRLGYPYVTTVQGLLTWYEQVTPLNYYQQFAAWLERRSYPRAPVVTTESSFAINFLKQRWPQMNVRQVEHAPDWKFHQLTRTPQLSPRRFLYVGVCSQIKGSDVLVRASENPEQQTLAHEREVCLRRALQRVGRAYRETVILRDIEGFTYEEIATTLGINVGTVKSRLARGRQELRKKLEGSL